MYSQGYFEVFSPEPKISLTNVTIIPEDNTCNVDFTLENAGNADGFAVIELRFGTANNLIEQNRYLIKANTIKSNRISTSAVPPQYCDLQQTVLIIARIEKG